jgi:hypothetical protein
MSYEERFELTTHDILNDIKKSISENYDVYFDMWLSCEADLPEIYRYYFKEHFGDLITDEIKSKIYSSGDNLRYAIQAYIKCNDEPSLEEVLQFAEAFFDYQMDEIDNSLDLSMTMYFDETKEYEMKECHNFSYCQNKAEDWLIDQRGGTCSQCWMYFGQINNTNESKECTICNEIKNIIKLSCNHEMCFDCWKTIAEDHTKLPTCCPYCRKQIGAWKIISNNNA